VRTDFIRDPDDPTFHPVRDVLERNVVAQLRKITFSALVYGGLIIFCLGGVVWGLDSGFQEVLPIHWSSNEPVLNFPVDLLFYNFLTPLAIVFFKPSDGLHAMYTWWFRKCARQLRLSWFLFGERHKDEEGRHVRRSWWDALAGRLGDCEKPVIGEDRRVLAEDRNVDVYFLRDGRYVRSPASDQVRIPKGGRVFHEIEESEVADDVAPGPEPGPGPRPADARLFETFYIPPWFRARIALFILCIWLFAALTGVGITILPLVIGRRVFATVFADHVRMNDVYAFSIGVYLVGGVLYLAFRYDLALAWMQRSLSLAPEPRREAAGKAKRVAIRAIRLIYTYAAFGLVLPTLLALVMEFYIIIPLHTALAPDQKHIIHFIQDWTLGVLYVKLAGRLILWHADARLGAALRAVVRQGWTNPDVQLATRAFILPVGVVMIGALVAPLPLGWVANQTYYARAPARVQRQVYRYSYPAVLCTVGCSMLISLLRAVMERWRRVIKDEVYLIGERLHNFGERKTSATVVASAEVGP
jgi:E3 ubiquitin-protein ligase MARCH6